MKRVLVITFAIVYGQQLFAAEGINSKVIHHYTEFGVAYEYFDEAAHGGRVHTSVDMENLLFDVVGGYAQGRGDLEFWRLGGGIGYIGRLWQNRVNIIPRFGVRYDDFSFGTEDDSTTSIDPGVTVSFAINNMVSLNGNYTYVRGIDDEDLELHTFGPGARVAVAENIGLDFGAKFVEGLGFYSAFGGVSFHF